MSINSEPLEDMQRLWRRLGIIGCAVLSIGITAKFCQQIDPIQQFGYAQERWQTNKPDRYRMTVLYDGLPGLMSCQQVVEVHYEAIARVIHNTCKNQSQSTNLETVSDIFARFHGAIIEQPCGPNGCQCDGVVQVNAVYDSQLGYPRQIETRLTRDWSNPSTWPRTDMMCTMIGFVEEHVEIVSLVPLSQ